MVISMLFYCLNYLLIQDYKRIDTASDKQIILKMKNDQIIINGNELKIIYLSQSEIKIAGKVKNIIFYE